MATAKPSEDATITPSKAYYGPLSNVFRIQAHQLIAWGYEDASGRIKHPNSKKDKYEPAITGFIAEAIQDRIDFSDRPRWCKRYSVHDDPPVKKQGTSGRDRPRADIIIKATFRGGPQYVFEAKLLRKNKHPVSGYTGSDGMGCFISGLYAKRYDEAGMLGYVQSDSLTYWKGEIKRKIETDASELFLKSPQRNVTILDNFPLEWTSEHERTDVDRPITIYHILLDCYSSPGM